MVQMNDRYESLCKLDSLNSEVGIIVVTIFQVILDIGMIETKEMKGIFIA